MAGINVSRWIIGGVAAAVVLFIVDFVLNALILQPQWEAAMAALNRSVPGQNATEIVLFAALNLAVGLAAVWIYAGIRPRFGPGATTAVYAGLVTWVIGYLVPNIFVLSVGLLPAGLLWTVTAVSLVQVPVATVIGAYLYQE